MISRQKRRTIARNAKKLKSNKAMMESFALVEAIKQMREAGAIEIDYDTYQVRIREDLFWTGKSEKHHHNWARNFKAYLDGLTNSPDDDQKQLQLYGLESGDLLITWPLPPRHSQKAGARL